MKKFATASFATGLVIGSIFFSVIASAWTSPTLAPPNGNVSTPVNLGTMAQTKNGTLGVNGLAVFGNTLLGGAAGSNAYLNFGATSGSGGYGIRDNAGVIEAKSSGGSWGKIISVSGNTVSIPSITFGDGTVQSTAFSSNATFVNLTATGTTQLGASPVRIYICPVTSGTNAPGGPSCDPPCAGQLATASTCRYQYQSGFNSNSPQWSCYSVACTPTVLYVGT